jgi:MoxR-like ATPase
MSRRVGKRAAPASTSVPETEPDFPDESEVACFAEPEKPRPKLDPAILAARRMLADALEGTHEFGDALERPGSVVVIISPSACWSRHLLHAVYMRSERLEPYLRDLPDPSKSTSTHDSYSHGPSWYVGTKETNKDDEFLVRIWRGKGVVAVSHDPALLPAAVLESEDARVTVSDPDAEAIGWASGTCTDGPTPWPFGEIKASVTPRMLMTSYRHGTPPSDGHWRLQKALVAIAERAAAAKTVSAKPAWALDRLHGMPEVTSWGRQLSEDVAAWRAGEIGWDAVDRGAMLVGPPGTGKTTVAAAIAAEAGLRFLPTSYATWESAKGGADYMVSRRMREAFEEARREPSLLFIDEMDSLPAREAGRHNDSWFRVIVNSLLECLDGSGGRGEVVVVGAANSVDNIDSAILRPGRLDRILRVPLPDRAALEGIVMEHVPELSREDARAVARRMVGKTGADVALAAKDGRRIARRAGRPVAVGDLLASLVADIRTTWDLKVAAVHEAGHAVACEALRPGAVLSVSILDSELAAGGVAVQPAPSVQSLDYIEARCIMGLSGRAAEEILLGQVSSGAGGSARSDLAAVTAEMVRARTALGLCGELAWRGEVDIDRAGALVSLRPDVARWAEQRMQELYGRALDLIGSQQQEVEALADALIARESLDGEEARAVIADAHRVVGRVAA